MINTRLAILSVFILVAFGSGALLTHAMETAESARYLDQSNSTQSTTGTKTTAPTAEEVKKVTQQRAHPCIPLINPDTPKNHYLRKQLVTTVGGVSASCSTFDKFVEVSAARILKQCKPYPGSSGGGATPQCPTASVSLNTNGKVQVICWHESKTGCGATAKSAAQKASEAFGDVEDEVQKKSSAEKVLNDLKSKNNGEIDPTKLSQIEQKQYSDAVETLYGEGNTREPTEFEKQNINAFKQKFGSENVTFQNGKIVVRVPETTLGGSVIGYQTFEVSADTPILGFGPDGPIGGGSGGSINTGGVVNTGGSVGSGNPVTSGGFGGPNISGAGVQTGAGNVVTGGAPYNTGYGSTYQSFQSPQSLQRPQSFIQQFAGYVTGQQPYIGSQADLRNSPQGQVGGQPQIIYVTPNYDAEAIANVSRSGRTVQEIASDISALTPTNFARVDHFAQTLESVGGPSENSIENKSFGRIQDLIVEDEAIRALRVAEEEGRRAKNTVYCRANETAESCDARREAKAKEVERDVFVAELEKRVLPDSAIEHFLAVYDGWVRPSPAPQTHATSTLGLLNTQNDGIADYELVTSGSNFVLWFIDSVADATVDAVNAVIGLFQ